MGRPAPMRMTRGVASGLALGLVACASLPPPGTLRTVDETVDLCPSGDADEHEVLLTYLGTGGFLLRYRDAALMTAPFYSNPSVLRVGLGFRLSPDLERIEALLPSRDRLEAVRGVLVGHAHYDHAMDLPPVLARLPGVPVYGNETLAHILKPVLADELRVALNQRAVDASRPGEWVSVLGSPFHILAIRSDHGPQLGRLFTLYHGRVDRDLDALPRNAYGWKDGMSLAYLIDVVRDDGSTALRLHYQDAPSHHPMGAPPASETRHVDVAIVCVGAFAGVADYPQSLLAQIEPSHVVLGHWEDFFRDPTLWPLRVVRANSLPAFLERLEPAIEAGSAWTLPNRDVTIRFRTCRD